MSGKVETGAAEVCSSQPSKPIQQKQESWEGVVYIVFSSVNLSKLKECGLDKSEVSEDGETVSIERWINETAWEYSPNNYTPDAKSAEKKIFVDCSDADGDEMYRACGAYGNDEKKDAKQSEIRLISEVAFAIRQFRDFLYAIEKEYVNGGKVKLCVSAVDPMECLMYAFLRTMELQIKQDDLSEAFYNKVLQNTVVSKFFSWYRNPVCKWTVELHYCSVQRIDVCSMKILTEKGKRMQRIKQMRDMRDTLKSDTLLWEDLYTSCPALVRTDGLSRDPSTQRYRDAVKDWKDKGGLTILGQDEWINGVSPQPGTMKWVDYPVLEFEGKKCSYYKFYRMVDAAEKAEAERMKPTAEKLEKQNEQLKNEIERQRTSLKDKRDNDRKGRIAEIEQKKCELTKRKEWGTDESSFWSERYMQDFNPEDDMEKEMGLIEFEGNMMSSDQLDGELNDINIENNRRRHDLQKLIEAQKKLQDKIDDLFWDKVLTGIQLGLTGVCMVAALFTGPFAGFVIGIGSAVIDAGIEVIKWGVIDDFEWNENAKMHMTTIVLDVVSVGLVPLFRKIPQATRLITNANDAVAKLDDAAKVYHATEGTVNIASKEFKDAVKFKSIAKIELNKAKKAAAQKVAQSELVPWRDAMVMANNHFPSSSLSNAIERTNTQINSIIENTIKNNRKLFTTAELEVNNKQGKYFAERAVQKNALIRYEAAAADTNVLLKDLRSQSLDLFSFYKENPFKNFNKASYLLTLGYGSAEFGTVGLNAAQKTSKWERFIEGTTKFLGYDNVVDLDKAAARMSNLNINVNIKKIQYVSAGYIFLNTSKHGWNLYNGFAYAWNDYINVDETLSQGIDQKPLNDLEAVEQVEADIVNNTVQYAPES